ncbi:Ergosterol biosynthetic protein 28 homolog [Geodia barretti]|uniref:Ergosterol biosynthetic protein 28 homolog n=1 Tax=Geodia barretti TaxID=519541 RepID=A0AA35TVZ1_GEOBA|nr:Ergosterol biosynthetic protein 28 homolog [Geodia barretti]
MLLTLLRCWVGLVAAMALVNAVQCFLDQQFPRDRIYDLQPSEATRLLSRMLGVWTLLAAFVRIAFVVSPHNKSVFAVTFASFVLAFAQFALEVFVYHTASPSFASIAPLFVSGVSIVWMTFVWPTISFAESTKTKRM